MNEPTPFELNGTALTTPQGWLWKVVVTVVAQLCLTLFDSMDSGPHGFSAHGVLQARKPEWVATPSSRGSSWPRDWTWVSCIADRFFTIWAPKEDYYLFIEQLLCTELKTCYLISSQYQQCKVGIMAPWYRDEESRGQPRLSNSPT